MMANLQNTEINFSSRLYSKLNSKEVSYLP